MTAQRFILCSMRGAVRGAETKRHPYHYTTWLRHHCAPGKISACAPGCCTQLPHRPRSRLSPWRRCSTGYCGTDVPGIRTPTPVSGGSWEQFCQPCPHFRLCLSVDITNVCWYSVIHQKGFILSPCVTLVPLDFHHSSESAEMRHFCELIALLSDKIKLPCPYVRCRFLSSCIHCENLPVLLQPRACGPLRHRSNLLSNPTKMELHCYSVSTARKDDGSACRPVRSFNLSLREKAGGDNFVTTQAERMILQRKPQNFSILHGQGGWIFVTIIIEYI